MKIKTLIKCISVFLMAFAWVMVIGSAGALENGNIGFGQCILQMAIAFAVVEGCIHLLRGGE